MEYFSLLGVATILIAVLTLTLYRWRRDTGFLLGVAALYYWSLFGAWYVVIDKSGGFSGKAYHYLEHKMFAVSLDRNYLYTLGAYAAFILLLQLTVLFALSRKRPVTIPKLVIRHDAILIVGFLAAAGSIYIIQDKLSAAWTLNTSAYFYTRGEVDQWFTLHQVLNRVALIPPAIGLATLAAGNGSRFFVNVVRRYTWLGYLLLFSVMGAFTFLLGNKNEIFVALLTGFLAYMASAERPNRIKVGLVVIGAVWFLYLIDFFRGAPLSQMSQIVSEQLDEATDVGKFLTSSNEAYAAHFSLYGVLASGAEPRFGYSLYSLACSIVPRVLWPERPPDIYLYYSESVGAIQNQGYSVHHATGWYLNFGYAGIVLGAVVMGLVWAYCLNAHQRIQPSSGLVFRLFATIAPWIFVAYLPPLIRAGPEGYKGFLVEAVAIPLVVLTMACRVKKAPKLSWSEQTGWVLVPPRFAPDPFAPDPFAPDPFAPDPYGAGTASR
jgi:hypothetical protein